MYLCVIFLFTGICSTARGRAQVLPDELREGEQTEGALHPHLLRLSDQGDPQTGKPHSGRWEQQGQERERGEVSH